MSFKEYKNFFSLEECNALINNFKKNVQNHEIYRNTVILKLKDASPKLINTLQKDLNLILNYGQIVHWPNGSFMNRHYDGTVFKDNSFSAICYLNDNFKGGRTLLQDKMINPETGKTIVFNSKKMEHGVEEVIGDRFTYISWWKKQR
tara:strand:- start:32 stop:472 length:441 start_codon:yes stop_codon:yes gene_type:complete